MVKQHFFFPRMLRRFPLEDGRLGNREDTPVSKWGAPFFYLLLEHRMVVYHRKESIYGTGENLIR